MENKKKPVGLIILVVILSLALIGTIGYILYDKGIIFSKKENSKIKEEVIEQEKEEIKYTNEELYNILSKFGYSNLESVSETSNNIFILFREGFEIDNIYAGQYASLVTEYIERENNGVLKSTLNSNAEIDGSYEISEEEFNEIAKKIFGPDFIPNDLYGNYINKCGKYIYYGDGRYVAKTHCGGISPTYVYYSKIDSYEVKDNELSIKLKVLYTYSELGQASVLYGKKEIDSNFDGINLLNASDEEKDLKYKEVFNKYEDEAIDYTIKLKIDDDNYYLKSIIK